jgi:hypothetical protein
MAARGPLRRCDATRTAVQAACYIVISYQKKRRPQGDPDTRWPRPIECKTLFQGKDSQVSKCCPRARGGDPTFAWPASHRVLLSPHTRGWSQQLQLPGPGDLSSLRTRGWFRRERGHGFSLVVVPAHLGLAR